MFSSLASIRFFKLSRNIYDTIHFLSLWTDVTNTVMILMVEAGILDVTPVFFKDTERIMAVVSPREFLIYALKSVAFLLTFRVSIQVNSICSILYLTGPSVTHLPVLINLYNYLIVKAKTNVLVGLM